MLSCDVKIRPSFGLKAIFQTGSNTETAANEIKIATQGTEDSLCGDLSFLCGGLLTATPETNTISLWDV